jgi:hypothetical protein
MLIVVVMVMVIAVKIDNSRQQTVDNRQHATDRRRQIYQHGVEHSIGLCLV